MVLERGSFDIDRIISLEPDFLRDGADAVPGAAHHVHDEHCGHDDGVADARTPDHEHDGSIGSICMTSNIPMQRDELGRWLTDLVAAQGQDILRAKGIVDVDGEDRRLVFQAVHSLLELDLQRPWKADEQRHSRLVFIGRNLDADALRAGLTSCEVPRGRF
jgi:G3E family GTPase